MALMRYEPWYGARQLQDDINRLFSGWQASDSSGVTADWVPSVDIDEYDDRFGHVDDRRRAFCPGRKGRRDDCAPPH